MRFYQFVLKNVFGRKVRSALTAAGIAVAIGAMVAFVGIAEGFKKSFLEVYQNRGIDLIVTHPGGLTVLNSYLPESLGAKVAAVDGVKWASTGLLDTVSFEDLGKYNIFVQGWPGASPLFKDLQVVKGRTLSDDDKGKQFVIMSKNVAESLKKNVGESLPLFEKDFEIVGTFESPSFFENNMIIMLLDQIQTATKKEGKVNGCTVKLKDGADMKDVQKRIETEVAAALHTKLEAQSISEYAKSFKQLLLVNAMAWITSAIALAIGGIFMFTTMVTSVFERTREIGILRAIGWGRWRILRMILMESFLLSLTGGAIGAAVAIAVTPLISRLPQVGGLVRSDISLSVVGQGFLIALLVGLVGAAYPAYRGASVMPTEAIRHE